MKKAQRILIATGLGLVASVAMFLYFNGANQRAEGAIPKAQVVIAKCSIPANSKIEPDELTVETRPTQFIPSGAIVNPSLVIGRTVKTEVATGETLVTAELIPPGQEMQTILPVPPGMRAVTVAVDEVVGVAGFVQPGMMVDVISTITINNQPVTNFLLQKVRVLACAQDAKRSNDPAAKVVSSVTLAVKPEDAEKLILAEDQGKIRLAMRDPKETDIAKTTEETPDTLWGQPRPAKPARPREVTRVVKVYVPVHPPQPAPQIMIIRGTTTELVSR